MIKPKIPFVNILQEEIPNEGLIFAFELDGKGGGRELGWKDLQFPERLQGPVWIHFHREAHKVERWLKTTSPHSLPTDNLLAKSTRPRCAEHDDGILLNLRGVNLNPGKEPHDMISVRIWMNDKWVISLRKDSLKSVHSIRERLLEGQGPKDTAELILMLAKKLGELKADLLLAMEEKVEVMEDLTPNRRVNSYLSKLSDLRVQISVMKRFMQPQQRALKQLSTMDLFLRDELEEPCRELIDQAVKHVEDLQGMGERTDILQDEMSTRSSAKTERTMYLLSVVTALFLPLGFFTGLLGINVGGMPGVDDSGAFWYVCKLLGVVFVVEVLLLFVYHRFISRWL